WRRCDEQDRQIRAVPARIGLERRSPRHYLFVRMSRMALSPQRPDRLSLTAAVAAAVLVMGGPTASALEVNRAAVLREGTIFDLQLHDTRQRRMDFQAEQNRFREQERRQQSGDRKRPKIPRFEGGCQVPPFGSTFLKSCR